MKKLKKGAFDILNDISENVTMVQLMNTIRNINYAISIVYHWLFDSKIKKALHLTTESLDLICSPSVGE